MIKKVSLFSKRADFFKFIFISFFILSYSLLIEFQKYKNLTKFDSYIIEAQVLSQYTKTKNSKTFQVLKLKSENGSTIYTSANKSLEDIKGKKISLEIWAGEKSFYEYLVSFYAYSKIIYIHNNITLKQKLNSHLSSSHKNEDITSIYQALYTASPLKYHLYSTFSALGVSHLLAISGFHLGVLSALLFFLIKYPYKSLQNKFFPYRSQKLDSFIIISIVLFTYLIFLDSPPSLVRAFGMLIIGFFLYDRGIKIISMQTLFLTVVLLLSFFPRLSFALGFWLSVAGVFYIFLFLIYFKYLSKFWQFILVPFWVYILMLPYSLAIFQSFSIYHPLSIIWTSLFTIFYPLSILLHILSIGDIFDNLLESFIRMGNEVISVPLSYTSLFVHISLSLLSVYKKGFIWILLLYSLSIFIYAVYHIA